MSRPDKILVIRNSALGDVAMTLPVLYSVANAYPDIELYLLTRPFFAKIFINRPDNLHIITTDYKGEYKGVTGLFKLIKDLSKYQFTAVADLHNVLRSWIIDWYMRLHGKRVSMVDKNRSARKSSMNLRMEQENFVSRYARVFKDLGYPVEIDFVSLFHGYIPETVVEIDHPAVGIAPFARYENKTYPLELMQQVVERLVSRGVQVFLFGAKGYEAEILDGWSSQYQNCTSLAGKIDLVEELKVMSKLDLMVTMDSANQHLASIVGAQVLSIWGSTTPGCGFYGYNQSQRDAVCLYLDCQPCTVAGSNKCIKGDYKCMMNISPDFIVDKVLRLIMLYGK